MKIGDTVKMSTKNPNHLGNGVSAYAGMTGIVTDIYDDGGFCLNCGTSFLVVPMNTPFKTKRKGVWIYLNDVHQFHKRIDEHEDNMINITTSKIKKFYKYIFK